MSIKINRTNLFIGILLFLLVVNLLVLFDLKLFYIRAALAFIFIITIPGLLTMLMLKIKGINFWEYLVYTIGLSISFIMFAGLAVNWILPWLHITDRPLATLPILTCFNIFLIIMWIVAFKRNKSLKYDIIFPELDTLNSIFFIIPMFFPILAILGAFILNNNGPNYLTMVMLAGIAVYVFMVVWYKDRLNENVYPWALYMIGLSLLLMTSMRGWYVVGGDIKTEFKIFQLTDMLDKWSMDNLPYKHAYNACISLNIFPTIINNFLKINSHYVFKIIYQLIYSIIGIIVFLISRKHISIILSFLSALFFIFFPGFIDNSPIILRQEIAFIFFGLSLLSIIENRNEKQFNSIILIILLFSISLSHYSSTYFSMVAMLIFVIFFYLIKVINKSKLTRNKGLAIILFLLFSFLWYSQITGVFDGVVNVAKVSTERLENIGSDGLISLYPKNNYQSAQEHINQTIKKYESIGIKLNENEQTQIALVNGKNLPNNFGSNKYIHQILPISFFAIDNLFKISSLIGLIIVFIQRNKLKNIEFIIFGLIFTLILVVTRVIPAAGLVYDPLRLHYQALFIVGMLGIIGVDAMAIRLKDKRKYIVVTLIIFYFIFTSGFSNQLVGSLQPAMKFNNFGLEYDRWYSQNSEISSAKWIINNYDRKSQFVIDKYDFIKFPYLEDPFKERRVIGTISRFISKDSYVYLDKPNKIEGITLIYPIGRFISLKFPDKYIKDNKNKIYNNGESEIFK